jgi:hypothetical protein
VDRVLSLNPETAVQSSRELFNFSSAVGKNTDRSLLSLSIATRLIPKRGGKQLLRFAFGQTIFAQPALGRFFIPHHYMSSPINRCNEIHAHPNIAGCGPMRGVFATGISGSLTHIICPSFVWVLLP